MSRLIDADEFLRKYNESKELVDLYFSCLLRLDVEGLISKMPTVDAAPVVRCKNCKYYDHKEGTGWCDLNSFIYPSGEWNSFDEDDYCSRGERNEDE